jgi:tripartite-type tricarboxylate transporter receptor subunit TctC
VSPQSCSESAAAAGETTLQTIVFARSGKKQKQLLKSKIKVSVAEQMVSPSVWQHQKRLYLVFLANRRDWVPAGTTLRDQGLSYS